MWSGTRISAVTYCEVPLVVRRVIIPVAASVLFLASCAFTGPDGSVSGVYYWTASYYAEKFHGRPTASGEVFDMYGRTAAHKTLPFGTRLHVTNTANGRSVVVTVNDRGPFVKGRQLDLSYGAAREIGMIETGTARVRVRVIGRDMRYVKSVRFRSGKGPFTIQAGSFSDRDNAYRLRNVLSRSYRNVYVQKVIVGGAVYYRVCIGKFYAKAAAERTARRLAEEGYGVMVITYGKRT